MINKIYLELLTSFRDASNHTIQFTRGLLVSSVFLISLFVSEAFLNKIATPQFYYFFLSTSALLIFTLLPLFIKNDIKIKFNIATIFIVIFTLYTLVNVIVKERSIIYNEKILILIYITFFYLILYNIFSNHENNISVIKLIFLSIFFVALIQIFIAYLQLFGYKENFIVWYNFGGNFANPNVLSTYLVSVLLFSVYFLVWEKDVYFSNKLIRYISIVILLSGVPLLLIAKSRASWIGLICGLIFILYYRYPRIKLFLFNLGRIQKFILLIISVITILSIGFGLYKLKPTSVEGRLFIWQRTASLIQDNFWFGIGYGNFPNEYNHYQAKYFQNNIDNESAWLADYSPVAYNEFLQIWAETGLIGLILFLLFIFSLFFYVINLQRSDKNFGIYIATTGSLIALLINSLFSFTIYILPIFILFIFQTALLSASSKGKYSFNIKAGTLRINLILLTLIVFFISMNLYERYIAERKLKEVVLLLQERKFREAEKICYNLKDKLVRCNDFYLIYAKTSYLLRKYDKSISIAKQGLKFDGDSKLYMIIGDGYRKLNLVVEASDAYHMASNIIPSRFEPYYSLMNLYLENNNIEKALLFAQKITKKNIKINSIEVEKMKSDAKKIIDTYKKG